MRLPATHLLVAAALLGAAAACEQGGGKAHSHAVGDLLAEVRARLAEREKKIAGFALTAEVTEGPHTATYEFWFRAPNKMRGDITEPASFSYAFDGRFLYQQSDERRALLIAELDPEKESTAVDLLQTFSPFAPEGFRTPLIRKDGALVQRVKHPLAAEAVEVKQTLRIDGYAHRLTYVLRWPSMDFLGKTVSSRAGTVETRVERESCVESLGLCFPRELSDWSEGRKTTTTVIPDLDFQEILPHEAFQLDAPRGFFIQQHFLDGGTVERRR
ncbi:MAG: hypothetical protein FJ086_11610 [Deltaproteobacteria bacterium]|nr:hypothetical protein [Deltaproteobacteria bacterium]